MAQHAFSPAASHGPEQGSTHSDFTFSSFPDEIKETLHGTALQEDALRAKGHHHDRIRTEINKELGHPWPLHMARLAMKHAIPVEAVLAPRKDEAEQEAERRHLSDVKRAKQWQNFQRRADSGNAPDAPRTRDWRERAAGERDDD